MRPTALFAMFTAASVAALVAACGPGPEADTPHAPLRAVRPNELRAPADFASIADTDVRSQALFVEATRVMLHPRCANCHPDGNVPLQGEAGMLHDPPVVRGADNFGVAGLRCGGCHQDGNLQHARVPGAPKWHLAPLEMAWVGRTPRQLCEQLKDEDRNGGKTVAQIVDHSAHDELVAWGWVPGHGRPPAPGSQKQFGDLMKAWMDTGAKCPPDGARSGATLEKRAEEGSR
jgi:hypothetical protein